MGRHGISTCPGAREERARDGPPQEQGCTTEGNPAYAWLFLLKGVSSDGLRSVL